MSIIIVQCVYPPIPIRQYDWRAYRDGSEEEGPYGTGETKEAAIQDLLEQEAEKAADLLERYETDRESGAVGE